MAAKTQAAFAGAPEVSHVAPPLAVHATWRCGAPSGTVVRADGAALSMRSYHARLACGDPRRAHAYVLQVLKDRRRHLTPSVGELRALAALLNHEPVLQQLHDKLRHADPCPKPFGYCAVRDWPTPRLYRRAVTDGFDDNGYTVDGLAYHCHCETPFSLECWRGVAAAADHIRSTGSGVTAAKAAEKRRRALGNAKETAC
ncbi:nuclear protein UL55 [Ateline alphaherpesvirus 1]|uniref:Nuclear protein UL55 n=1 Tax=Herpesvirus ateles type 1 (strain Lennette) TaxID=35243 RepID=A0A1S6JLK1_HSVA1|nr:nuclear protein UL55 [Ateline alphaherpesvirus 1]AQS79161.1 nuclear protein UL55 [Ateline alphaherpesvirus 1]